MSDLENIKKKAPPILKEAGVTRSSIFGSYVRGEAKETSDIDILIDAPKKMGLFDFVGLKQDLEKALGKKVDLGEFSTLKPRIKDQVLSQGVRILQVPMTRDIGLYLDDILESIKKIEEYTKDLTEEQFSRSLKFFLVLPPTGEAHQNRTK